MNIFRRRATAPLAAILLIASFTCVAGGSPEPALPIYDYGYDITLKSGTEALCTAYLQFLSKASFPQPARCARPDPGNVDGFKGAQRKPLAPEEVGNLYAPVMTLFGKKPAAVDRGGRHDPDARFVERAQKETIEAGRPDRFFYGFSPRPDIDNDGSPDDIVIWKDVFVPCGVVRYSEPEFSATRIVILDLRGNLDANRTASIFSFAPDAKSDPSAIPPNWLGESFGVFQFRGEFYFDTFNSYSNLPRGADEEDFLNTLSIYQRKGGKTRLVCEIGFSPVG
jgi:hypothetical protein